MKIKIILFLSILSSISLFTSCTKTEIQETVSSQQNTSNFTGTWNIVQRDQRGAFIEILHSINIDAGCTIIINDNNVLNFSDNISNMYFQEQMNLDTTAQGDIVGIIDWLDSNYFKFGVIGDTLYGLRVHNQGSGSESIFLYDKYVQNN